MVLTRRTVPPCLPVWRSQARATGEETRRSQRDFARERRQRQKRRWPERAERRRRRRRRGRGRGKRQRFILSSRRRHVRRDGRNSPSFASPRDGTRMSPFAPRPTTCHLVVYFRRVSSSPSRPPLSPPVVASRNTKADLPEFYVSIRVIVSATCLRRLLRRSHTRFPCHRARCLPPSSLSKYRENGGVSDTHRKFPPRARLFPRFSSRAEIARREIHV